MKSGWCGISNKEINNNIRYYEISFGSNKNRKILKQFSFNGKPK